LEALPNIQPAKTAKTAETAKTAKVNNSEVKRANPDKPLRSKGLEVCQVKPNIPNKSEQFRTKMNNFTASLIARFARLFYYVLLELGASAASTSTERSEGDTFS
jgi:hypothetical protein